jgi:hypothetical protein
MNTDSNTENIFAWSNVEKKDLLTKNHFTPQTSNTLYINSNNGVAINTTTPTATLTVNQMIQIGDEAGPCTSDKKGQIIFRNNCFYACSDGQHWDNLAGTPACK